MDNKDFLLCDILMTLPKETWLDVADDLNKGTAAIAKFLFVMDREGEGLKDAKEFIAEMHLAIQAMWIISELSDRIKVFVSTDLPRFPGRKGGDTE